MREIRFRAWGTHTKKMHSWAELLNLNLPNIMRGSRYTGMVLMQYTGLKDRNGVEIYEGDIVVGAYHWQIVYAPEYGAWSLHDKNGIVDLLSDYDITNNNFIVIGNIYENPELLNE